jgi:hypothetical protein
LVAVATAAYQAEILKVVYLVPLVFGSCAIGEALFSPNLEPHFTDGVARRLTPTPSEEEVSKRLLLAVVFLSQLPFV